MISLRLAQASLAVSVLTCSYAFGQTFDYKQWDVVDVPTSPAQSLPDGSTAIMTQTSPFANTSPKKTFSLGIFKSGSMHRVTLETLGLGGGSACEELTFSLGYFVTYDWVQFHSHHIYGDNSTCHFYWSPTYESSGAIKYAEMELFATVDPQTVDVRMRAHYYGQTGNWVSTAAKTSISTYQLPLRQVIAAQTNYSHMGQNWVYLTGDQVYANDSPVLTQATGPSFLSGQGFLQASGFNAALASSTPPTSSTAWKNAFVPRGNPGGGGLLALGSGADVYGAGAVAIGGDYAGAYGTGAISLNGAAYNDHAFATTLGSANGFMSFATQNSFANGIASIAMGGYDLVLGGGNEADADNAISIGGIRNQSTGVASFSSGNWSVAKSAYSTALGSLNIGSSGSSINWVETDSLFELGNGIAPSSPPSSTYRSNAITTLKNGRTTLTNKAWLANTGHPLDDPASTTDSGGKALVVEGHTELKGKVIISEPQGDISMGIYE